MASSRGAAPHGSLRAARSSPALSAKSGLHHRGEHAFGSVKGVQTAGQEYVPRALWTASLGSPLKNPRAEYDPELHARENKDLQQYRRSMTNYMRDQLGRQLQERNSSKADKKAAMEEELRATKASLSQTMQAQRMESDAQERAREVFREGLAEQASHNAQRAREARLREAHEAAEIKLRTTQQLCAELEEAQRKKEETKREFSETMQRLQKEQSQKRLERTQENQELRRTLQMQVQDEAERPTAQQLRVREALASQEVRYKHFEATSGKEDADRIAREERRQERDAANHQLRTDMMYAQRELARERQRQRMRQNLDDQVEMRHRQMSTTKIQQGCDRHAVDQASRGFLEDELTKAQARRAEERENQALLIEQMRDKQQRLRDENGAHYRPPLAAGTMQVSDSLMAIAQASKGKASEHGDLMDKLHAAKDLSKPCGKPEVKPWIDITKSYGPGGLVGVFGSEGACRSVLMCTGGAGRLLTKTMEIVDRDRDLNKKWTDGVSSAHIKAGRQAAAKRLERSAADKALTHPP